MEPKKVFYDYLMSYVNTPYSFGGDDFSGIDCSGLILIALQSVGVFPYKQDTTAQGLYTYFQKYITGVADFGTLMFYGKSVNEITHVNMALNYVQSIGAEGGTAEVRTKEDAAKANAFVKILPIGFRGVPVAMALPQYPWRAA
jgi:cell wall-associated NlpC family hydrolase